MSEVSDYETLKFYEGVSSWGSLDVDRALRVWKEAGLYPEDLAEEIRSYISETEAELENIDVCYIAYESILQRARNKISEVTRFDFLNDGLGDIYTYGNAMCSSYDRTENTTKELKEVLEKVNQETREELLNDNPTKWFLQQIEVIE